MGSAGARPSFIKRPLAMCQADLLPTMEIRLSISLVADGNEERRGLAVGSMMVERIALAAPGYSNP